MPTRTFSSSYVYTNQYPSALVGKGSRPKDLHFQRSGRGARGWGTCPLGFLFVYDKFWHDLKFKKKRLKKKKKKKHGFRVLSTETCNFSAAEVQRD